MYKDIIYGNISRNKLIDLILSIKDNEYPLIIREACNGETSEDYWYDFIKNNCNLKADHRHIGFDGSSQKSHWWEISNQKDKSVSYAYSTTPQPFHRDNAWFCDGPEVNFFIMKKQATEGGEQLFYPASRLINDLQDLEPSLYADLINTPVTIRKGDDEYKHTTPIISLNDGGKIYWNYYRTVKTNKFVRQLCKRFFTYLRAKESSNSIYTIRCESGDAFVFNDQRTLHARKAFKAKKCKERILLQSMWKF